MTAHNKKLPSRDFNAKKNVGAPRPKSKNADVFPTTTGSIKFFRKVRHKVSECFLRVQERNPRKNSCYRCGELGHTFMQCEKGNRLARGGAGARERAYKIARAMPIKKFRRKEDEKKKIVEV